MSYGGADLIQDISGILEQYHIVPDAEYEELWHIAEDVETALMQRRDLIEALQDVLCAEAMEGDGGYLAATLDRARAVLARIEPPPEDVNNVAYNAGYSYAAGYPE